MQLAAGETASNMARQRGFTLVELVVVIVIVGILAAVVASRLASPDAFAARAYADQATALLRYGQKMAIAQNRPVWVRVNASGVALCYTSACGAGNRVRAPGNANSGSSSTNALCGDASWACEAPPTGVTVTSAVSLFYFDPLGKPFALGDVTPTTMSTFSTLIVTVAHAGISRSVAVEAETGYVH